MIRNIFLSLGLYFACLILILAYSLFLYFISHSFMDRNASGRLIRDREGNIRGSELLVQYNNDERFFKTRTNKRFYSDCDLALYNSEFKSTMSKRFNEAATTPYDVSMLTPSASFLDPYIMKRDAVKQVINIADKRDMDVNLLLKLIDKYTLDNIEPFFDLEIVNTTLLNADLQMMDEIFHSNKKAQNKLN